MLDECCIEVSVEEQVNFLKIFKIFYSFICFELYNIIKDCMDEVINFDK